MVVATKWGLTSSLFSVSSFMMLAMTGVEEEMLAGVVESFIEVATASFFFISLSLSLRMQCKAIQCNIPIERR